MSISNSGLASRVMREIADGTVVNSSDEGESFEPYEPDDPDILLRLFGIRA